MLKNIDLNGISTFADFMSFASLIS